MTELIDLTLTLGSDRVVAVPGLVGVCTEPLHTHETHARSNTKLTLATHLGTHVDGSLPFPPRRHHRRGYAPGAVYGASPPAGPEVVLPRPDAPLH